MSHFFIKTEPLDIDNDDELRDEERMKYCRCCFKYMLPTENMNAESEALMISFASLIQMPLQESLHAKSFCFDCSLTIGSFIQFKKLATLKQEKFNEISDPNDFGQLFFIKLKADPLTMIIKEETGNMSMIRNEEIEATSTESRNKRYSKKETTDLICPICTAKVNDVVQHLRLCKGKKCENCNFKSVDADEMEQHKRENHNSKKRMKKNGRQTRATRLEEVPVKEEFFVPAPKITYDCDLCGKQMLKKSILVAHVSKHMKDKPIKCSLCSYSTTFQKYLNNHMKKMHDESNPKKKRLTKKPGVPSGAGRCQECHKEFRCVRSHFERVHGNIKNFQCQDCGRGYYSKFDLLSHVDHRHKKQLSELDLTKFVCETCGKGFARKQFYELHKRTHLTLDFKCHICDKMFAMKSRVEEHIKRSHLKIMDKECDVCGKRFFNTSKLNVHYNVHAGIKFHCFLDGCSATRSRRDAMVYHMKNDHHLDNDQREQFMEKLNAVCAQLKKR